MKKKTPREELSDLNSKGFYDIKNQFAVLIENRLYQQATKIMNSLNPGVLWSNERLVHNQIYNYLLDGFSIKDIKSKFC